MYICIYIYIYTPVYMYIYIYMYTERKRERERDVSRFGARAEVPTSVRCASICSTATVRMNMKRSYYQYD